VTDKGRDNCMIQASTNTTVTIRPGASQLLPQFLTSLSFPHPLHTDEGQITERERKSKMGPDRGRKLCMNPRIAYDLGEKRY
jgi:hypothetical protein